MASDIDAVSSVDDGARDAANVITFLEDYGMNIAALEKFVRSGEPRGSGSNYHSSFRVSNVHF